MNNNNFIDLINIASFLFGIINLQENLTQGDKQDILDNLNKEYSLLLNNIHQHLQEQDRKIDKILEILKEEDKNGQ